MADSPSFFPITDCGITRWPNRKVRPILEFSMGGNRQARIHNTDQDSGRLVMKNQLMVMKNHFITLGCFLLLAVIGFALDVGITATLLRF
jgi:hypothetical protein